MATLDEIPVGLDPVHLLLIGDTKTGKSTYAAEAAIAGFDVIYIDGDNGLSALQYAMRAHAEARKRVHYINVRHMSTFLMSFLRSTQAAPLKWTHRTQQGWNKLAVGLLPEDKVSIYDVTAVPKSWVLVIDSWTATAADALGIGSADQKAELLDGVNQAIYGEANVNLNYICNILQKIPCHVIVQAHGTKFEVYDKPLNMTPEQAKQKMMVLREIIDVPLSSSRPHGLTMGSRFNHIGWLSVNGVGETDIDFTRRPNRVGGGPPNKKAKTTELSFAKLVGSVPPHEEAGEWEIDMTHEQAATWKRLP